MDKYEGLSEVIDRIINSDEIGVDDLLADSMAVKDGINELLAEVKRLREEVKVLSKYRDIVIDFVDKIERLEIALIVEEGD